MSPGALLIPNLGAEEGGDWRKQLEHPAPATVARLWQLLFHPDSRSEPDQQQLAWPTALGDIPNQPAFSWLEDSGGAVAWLPNDAAQRVAREAGTELSGPAPDVVARVHDKAFAQRVAEAESLLPRPLRSLITVFDPAELADAPAAIRAIRERLASWPAWTGQRFTLKPRIGTSGRGRVPGEGRQLDETAIAGALPRLAERGGALLEPWLDRVQDLSVQLHVNERREITLLGTLEQKLSRSGLYEGHRGVVDWRGRISAGSKFDEALKEAGSDLARCAAQAGFHGACGADAFSFRIEEAGEEPREVLRPVVEFNARFTTGTVVKGLVRRVLPRLGLEPGDTRPFEFVLDSRANPPLASQLVFPLSAATDPLHPELRFEP